MSAAEIDVPFSFLNVKYAKKFGKFNDGVLLGNWFEERVRLEDKRKSDRSGAAVKTMKPCDLCCFGEKMRDRMPDHSKAPRAAEAKNNRRVALLQREMFAGRGGMKECLSDARIEYFDNMTSKYTLDFGPHNTKTDPLRSYGNLTHFGLKDWHNCMRNTNDGRCCYTLMKENMQCHKYSALQTQHKATAAEWSTKLHKTNLVNKNLVLRNDKKLHISNNSNITVHNK